ncbi:Calcineurin-like_phosphoesterase [Hexamita inflata]|uniref:Calcineurin-like_phosphoesterase n=1 Tax=Hexamita inflata TaxID=28002 RepID=A0ABP1HE95_9EUKA
MHGKHNKLDKYLPGGDVLFCTGDITPHGKHSEEGITEVLFWLNKQNYARIVFVAGNHDYFFQKNRVLIRQLVSKFPKLVYLEDEQIWLTINNVTFSVFGSPHAPVANNNAFLLTDPDKLNLRFAAANHPDVVLTHGPPHGILDGIGYGRHAGCRYLHSKLKTLNPKLFLFGHIHQGYGHEVVHGTHYFNGSVLTKSYQFENVPISFVWKFDTN